MGHRDRPSKKHVIWTVRTRNGASKKRVDGAHFKRWASHYNLDFEKTRRVDHDRAEESRVQFRCVFAWGRSESRDIEFGDESWELAGQETPRTFIEIDESGAARIKGWTTETICDITEMRFDGPTLYRARATRNASTPGTSPRPSECQPLSVLPRAVVLYATVPASDTWYVWGWWLPSSTKRVQ